jgi:hypothetical protein
MGGRRARRRAISEEADSAVGVLPLAVAAEEDEIEAGAGGR